MMKKSRIKRLMWIVPALVIAGGASVVAGTRWVSARVEPQDTLGEEGSFLASLSSWIMPHYTLGIEDGTLTPCPENTMNCVNSRSETGYSAMEPLSFEDNFSEAKARIKTIVDQMPRSELQADEENYLHFTFRSAIFGFVDDVEFQIDDEAKVIHFRSAARLGYGDLGVNRSRMEEIREAFLSE